MTPRTRTSTSEHAHARILAIAGDIARRTVTDAAIRTHNLMPAGRVGDTVLLITPGDAQYARQIIAAVAVAAILEFKKPKPVAVVRELIRPAEPPRRPVTLIGNELETREITETGAHVDVHA